MLATLSLSAGGPLLATLTALASPACRDGEAAPAGGPGPLVAEQAEVQFGRVFEGSLLEHVWSLRVAAPVSVSATRTDCGCTLAELEREGAQGRQPYTFGTRLAAGERLIVHATYDTRGKRGPTHRAVTLSLEGDAVLPLALNAEVLPWLVLDPGELDFLRVTEGQGAERAFRVSSVSGEPFGLRATRVALPPWVQVELVAEAPDAAGRARVWRARVALGTEAPRGTFSYPLELETDVEIPEATRAGAARHYSASPSWSLQVVGPVALSTPTLEFGLVRADETVSKSLRLESFEPGFSVANARAELRPLHPDEPFALARTARVSVRPGAGACEVEVTLAGLDPEVNGTFLGLLVVETGHPRLPELQALVRGVRAQERAR